MVIEKKQKLEIKNEAFGFKMSEICDDFPIFWKNNYKVVKCGEEVWNGVIHYLIFHMCAFCRDVCAQSINSDHVDLWICGNS